MIPALIALANFAPMLTKYLGAGDKTQKIAEDVANVAQIVTGTSRPESAIEVLKGSSEAQVKFQEKVMELAQEWDKLLLQDTQNARARDVELRKAGDKNTRANVLVVVTFVIVI